MLSAVYALLAAVLVLPVPGHAWWGRGHEVLTRAAIRGLPADMPAFLRAGEATVAHAAYDPDLYKNPGLPHLTDAEHSEHYLDLELVERALLPETRYAFFDMCAARGLNPSEIGLLPYAIAEWVERLALAFAEHRRWPANPVIQQKCLLHAGMLAHYAQDACQPLHVTVHYDGRKLADGSVQGRGVHEDVDALIERLDLDADKLAGPRRSRSEGQLMASILAEIDSSRALLDTVYRLAPVMANIRHPAVRAFGVERARAAVGFTVWLYHTAWRRSAQVSLPQWHER